MLSFRVLPLAKSNEPGKLNLLVGFLQYLFSMVQRTEKRSDLRRPALYCLRRRATPSDD
jgi:hypothetical protein